MAEECCRGQVHSCVVIFVLCVAMLCGSYTGTYVFSYLPEMIVWLGYKEEQKGVYAGLIASLYYFGMGITGYVWGWSSDKVGRRWILATSLILNGIVCLGFGFSFHIAMAVVFRFLNGAADCVYVIINSTVADQFEVDFQPIAQIVLHVALSLGNTMGPGIAGFLSSPVGKYPKIFASDGFFYRFPYILPGIVGIGINLLGAILVLLLYPKTTRFGYDDFESDADISQVAPKKQTPNLSTDVPSTSKLQSNENSQQVAISNKNEIGIQSKVDDKSLPTSKSGKSITQETAIAKKLSNYGTNSGVGIVDMTAESKSQSCTRFCIKCCESDLINLLQNSEALALVFAFALLLYSIIGHTEIFTVWASTKQDLGGLGLRSDHIGLILMISIIPAYILTFFTFVQIQKRLGNTTTFLIYGTIFIVMNTALPTVRYLDDIKLQWGLSLLAKIIIQMATNACFTLLSFLINNSVPPEQLGAINGISIVMSSIPMALSPIISGVIFSASLTYEYESALDSSLVFVIFGITVWLSCVIVYLRPRIDPDLPPRDASDTDTSKTDVSH